MSSLVAVVEDDETVALLLESWLEVLGVESMMYRSSHDLLLALGKADASRPGHVLLDLTDTHGRKVGTDEVGRLIELGARVVLVSGSSDAANALLQTYPDCAFLEKPFDLAALERALGFKPSA